MNDKLSLIKKTTDDEIRSLFFVYTDSVITR